MLRRTFAALTVRNFRLYFAGQMVSVSGTWMQRVAQSWLVLDLTGSGTAVGAVTAVQFLPLLVVAPWGGVVADRVDKRKLLYVTQALASLTAAVLGLLVLTGQVELWMVFVLALTLGIVGSFDNPARNSLVMEMVGRKHLTSAIGLNSVLVNTARIAGPAVGGVLIVTVGLGACFLLNSGSYLALISALALMRGDEIDRPRPEPRRRGQLIAAWKYARNEPALMVPLVMMAVFGVFSYEFEVVLPLLARFTFDGDADTFGTMFAAMGVGAVIGGLYTANRGERPGRTLVHLTYGVAASITVAALMPNLALEHMAMVTVGATTTAFLTLGDSVLQINSVPEMRGRVTALRAMAVLGARPIGGPIVGWVGEHLGPRYGLGLGALAAALVAVWAHRWIKRHDRSRAEVGPATRV